MTPAVNLLKQRKIPHQLLQYQHDPGTQGYAQEAADKLQINAAEIFKTLVAQLDDASLVVAIVAADDKLNLKQLAKAAGARKAAMADVDKVQKSTGYVLGGVSPLGQKRKLPTFMDEKTMAFSQIYVSGGKRGLEIGLNPNDLQKILGATVASLAA